MRQIEAVQDISKSFLQARKKNDGGVRP